jgi:hypothetical protein
MEKEIYHSHLATKANISGTHQVTEHCRKTVLVSVVQCPQTVWFRQSQLAKQRSHVLDSCQVAILRVILYHVLSHRFLSSSSAVSSGNIIGKIAAVISNNQISNVNQKFVSIANGLEKFLEGLCDFTMPAANTEMKWALSGLGSTCWMAPQLRITIL